MPGPNFLIGYGERLTEPVDVGHGPIEKKAPYSFSGARDRLAPMVVQVAEELDQLPPEACPGNEAVSVVTLHPEYIAKSYYPGTLFHQLGLEAVGSRPRKLTPERSTRKKGPVLTETTEIFVAAPRSTFRSWAHALPAWSSARPGADDLPKIEQIRADSPDDRIRLIKSALDELYLEVVLHAHPLAGYVVEAFEAYLAMLDIPADLNRRLYAGRLCFVPVRTPKAKMRDLAKFSFLRTAREMPKLRQLSPVRSYSLPAPFPVALPTDPPLNPDVRAAIFDGGLNSSPALDTWVVRHDAEGVATPHAECTHHGSCVTSALLFGSVTRGQPVSRPYAYVDHYRVLDDQFHADADLFDVLHRIQAVLQGGRHSFLNLSIGPDLPVDDDEVHAWTAVLDDLLSSGEILATVAVGNNGEGDAVLGFNRVQVPSDCVNVLAVGSADSLGGAWSRAPYSAVGPGRSPGLIKPDVLAFGGSDATPFAVLDPDLPAQALHVAGTSFAAPSALRLGLGVRAHFGDSLSPLAIKALLVHCSEEGANLERREQGWGRIPSSIEDLVVCPENTARIVYQGDLSPAQYLRAQIPLPDGPLQGNVTISATICYATPVDPEDPGSYTRSGLEVIFRPHSEKFAKEDAHHPKTDAFFQLRHYSTEKERRRDAHKWETVLHRRKKKQGRALKNPVLDIHFTPRASGRPVSTTDKIRYALVITVESHRTPDLYDRIVTRYRTLIRPLTPLIQIPIRT